MVSSTDGVGTKLKIAFMMDKHDTIGIDMVAMVINDVVVTGAKPLFMLDYLATGKLELGVAEAIIAGVVEGCRQGRLRPDRRRDGRDARLFTRTANNDLAGFGVGVVDRDAIIDGSSINKNSAMVGLASSGLHSNGYSLVRRILFEEMGLGVADKIDDLPLSVGEELLTPTRIYTETVAHINRDFTLQAWPT